MGKWDMVRLGDVCEIKSGGTPSRAEGKYWIPGEGGAPVPWVKISDMKHKYVADTEENITTTALRETSAKLFPAGTILYTIFATLGRVAVLSIDAATNQAIAGIIVPRQINTDFLYYYLMSIEKQVLESGRGVAQNNINLSILREFQIPLPLLPTQQKIADVLNRASALIEKRKSQIAKLDLLVKSRFVEMFGDPVRNPMGWEVKAWNDVLKIKNGKDHKKVSSQGGKYPIIGSGGCMGYANEYLCEANSIIIGRKGTIDKPFIVREKFWNVDTAFGLESYARILNFEYLLLFCKFFDFQKLNKTVTIPSLTKSDLLKIPIPLPPLKLQTQFADFVRAVDKSKAEMQAGLNKIELLYKSLMQKCFSGEMFK
ncbi:MAG: restriction endonuclease subunit S [Oscillospiraceae bacterium]|nr:restriction endonuclease subunit S [Oscillospiraceae bacterium]